MIIKSLISLKKIINCDFIDENFIKQFLLIEL